jgi:hypothetical protein
MIVVVCEVDSRFPKKETMQQAIRSKSKLSRPFLTALVLSSLTLGCSKSDSSTADAPTTDSSSEVPTDVQQQLVANDPARPFAEDRNVGNTPQQQFQLADTAMFQPEPEAAAPIQPEPRNLRDDLSPDQLVEFLASADKDMELIHTNRSGIEDPRQARDALLQIINMKLQAARQLAAHADASVVAKSEGNRGELQSLSHLAALSDVNAAKELEQLANKNMASEDSQLVADSRLVLIGFSIESLQNGKAEAAEKIVEYIDQIASSDTAADVPALIVMGQAKQMLENYDHADLAKHVRDTIIKTFGDSENADVATMAAQIAGNVLFDGIDELRGQILDGDAATVEQWVNSMETLIQESADLQTVRYLAGASVDFEASGLGQFADATLKTLSVSFQEPDAATTREVQTAIAATEARQRIIGQEFNPDLPSVDGSSLSMKTYRGKVVLVPFWGMGIPLSLQPIPILRSIQQTNPKKIAIVGVNLDPSDAPVNQFVRENEIKFPSYSLASNQASQIPRDFGMVSMPFVAIIDTEGKVAAIQLSDRNLEPTVKRLIAE